MKTLLQMYAMLMLKIAEVHYMCNYWFYNQNLISVIEYTLARWEHISLYAPSIPHWQALTQLSEKKKNFNARSQFNVHMYKQQQTLVTMFNR